MNETCTKRGLKQEDQEYQELGKEHNCIPGFDSHPLDDRDMYYDQDEEEFLDEMYASNTSSRDSGYGTTRTKQNVKDVFNHRLSSLFHSKDSHFVKFKTWSTQQQHKKSVSDSSCTPVKYVTRRKSSSSVIYPVSNVNHLELVDEDRNLLAKYVSSTRLFLLFFFKKKTCFYTETRQCNWQRTFWYSLQVKMSKLCVNKV